MKYIKSFENINEVDPYDEEDWNEEDPKLVNIIKVHHKDFGTYYLINNTINKEHCHSYIHPYEKELITILGEHEATIDYNLIEPLTEEEIEKIKNGEIKVDTFYLGKDDEVGLKKLPYTEVLKLISLNDDDIGFIKENMKWEFDEEEETEEKPLRLTDKILSNFLQERGIYDEFIYNMEKFPYDEFIYNMEKFPLQNKEWTDVESYCDEIYKLLYIMSAFDWKKTPQGSQYWTDIDDIWYTYLKKYYFKYIKEHKEIDPFDEEDWDEKDLQLIGKYVFTIYRDADLYYFNIGKIIGWAGDNFSVDYYDYKGDIVFKNINYPISSLIKDNEFVSSFTRSSVELVIFLDEDESIDNIMKHKGIIDDFVNNKYFSFNEDMIGKKESF